MAMISAWAVGSFFEVTSLQPPPMIWPFLTTTAPKGPPRLVATPSRARRIASDMNEQALTAGGSDMAGALASFQIRLQWLIRGVMSAIRPRAIAPEFVVAAGCRTIASDSIAMTEN